MKRHFSSVETSDRRRAARKTALALAAVFFGIGVAEAAAQTGTASYYGIRGRTASGTMHSPHGMTAAHRSLPFGTMVRVTNLRNGKKAVVKIHDRGPFIRGRIIDVSTQAASVLGFKQAGLAPVRLEIVN